MLVLWRRAAGRMARAVRDLAGRALSTGAIRLSVQPPGAGVASGVGSAGLAVGSGVGGGVGSGVGGGVGSGVGGGVGSTVGLGVGLLVGRGVGSAVGLGVGARVGRGVGAGVGRAVGWSPAGRRVGSAVGVSVGGTLDMSDGKVGSPTSTGDAAGLGKRLGKPGVAGTSVGSGVGWTKTSSVRPGWMSPTGAAGGGALEGSVFIPIATSPPTEMSPARRAMPRTTAPPVPAPLGCAMIVRRVCGTREAMGRRWRQRLQNETRGALRRPQLGQTNEDFPHDDRFDRPA